MTFASPPCLAHEMVFTGDGIRAVDAETARDVARWRKAARERLFATRRTIPGDERRAVAQLIAQSLDRIVANPSDPLVSGYWPTRHALDLIHWMRGLVGGGSRVGRPVGEGGRR